MVPETAAVKSVGRPFGPRRRTGKLLPALLCGVLALGFGAPMVSVHAQDQKAAEQAAAEAAARAKAKAEAEEKARAAVFAKYMQEVRELTEREAKLEKARESKAQGALEDQRKAAQEQVTRRNREEQESKQLDKRYATNKAHLEEISQLLKQHEGNLGELFGVTRQVAGDVSGTLEASMLSTEFHPPEGEENRIAFMKRIAAAKALPSIDELRRIWFELQREMTKNGSVDRYTAPVVQLDGKTKDVPVTRVGPFTVTTGDHVLGYSSSDQRLLELNGQLPPMFRQISGNLDSTSFSQHPGYVKAVVDPSGATGGGLLGIYLRRPDLLQRIDLGEEVGYVIIAVGIIGLLLAFFQYFYLFRTHFAVKAQLRRLDEPSKSNPLGRLMLAFEGHQESGSADVAELRLSEAVLRELPKLERFQSFLRLAIAAGPLLGLIGTVIGMIITFHAIVASGASDPKLMAKGIGQAMIATVLGLSVAIPLLFLNTGLVGISRSLIQVLDEHSQSMLGEKISKQHGEATRSV